MNYEVFDPQGASIFPSSGGGLSSIQVNPGDTVLLNLYITRGNVAMLAKDWNTSSTAVQTYSAARANSFVGMTSSFADRNGFFTGLMTERYHVHPYYSNDEESTFSNHTHALTSAWMWIDEFGIAPFQPLFSDASRSPIILSSNPDQLQPFGSHGAYEAVDSYEFVTGFQPTPVQVSRPIPQPVSSDVGQLVSFTCGATGGIPPFTYSWTFGDGSGATGQNVSHTFNSPGTMNIQCTVIDKLQTSSQNATSIMVLSDPSINLQTANPTSVDIGQTVTVTAQATGGSGGYAYLWTGLPTGCSSSNIPTISCQPTATGTFPVTANITDSNGFSITSSTLSVTVSPDLSLTSFTASPDKLDIGQTLTFAASASGGSGGLSFAYYGLPTGCETANSTSLSCTPSTVGNYTIEATVADEAGQTSTTYINMSVNSIIRISTLNTSLTSLDTGQEFTLTLSTTGGTAPLSYSYSGLPPRSE